MKKLTGTIFIIVLSAIFLAGCGIKPKKLDAPAGTQENSFPRSYPTP